MEAKELINRISVLNSDIHKYITDTEHWLFYWITNVDIQDFIAKYPEDYEYRVHLHVENLDVSPMLRIIFDEHPDDVESILMYAELSTFRDSVKAKWLEWNGKIKEFKQRERLNNAKNIIKDIWQKHRNKLIEFLSERGQGIYDEAILEKYIENEKKELIENIYKWIDENYSNYYSEKKKELIKDLKDNIESIKSK